MQEIAPLNFSLKGLNFEDAKQKLLNHDPRIEVQKFVSDGKPLFFTKDLRFNRARVIVDQSDVVIEEVHLG